MCSKRFKAWSKLPSASDWDKLMQAYHLTDVLSKKYLNDSDEFHKVFEKICDAMWVKQTTVPQIKRFLASWTDEGFTPVTTAYVDYLQMKNFYRRDEIIKFVRAAIDVPDYRLKFLKGASFNGFKKAMENSGFEVVTVLRDGKQVECFRGRYDYTR